MVLGAPLYIFYNVTLLCQIMMGHVYYIFHKYMCDVLLYITHVINTPVIHV